MAKGSIAADALLALGDTEKTGDEGSTSDGSPGDEGFAEVADQAFDALKGDDREGFQDALKAAIEACMVGDKAEGAY